MDLAVKPPPFVPAERLTGGAPIVVLAPHPDYESLGCGALLAHAFAHHGAHVICMTDGSASHPGSQTWPPSRIAAQRHRELLHAIRQLGGKDDDLTWLGHTDGWLGAQDCSAIMNGIHAVVRRTGAQHVFAPSFDDHHEDHKATARIAVDLVADNPGLTLFTYPLWSRWDDPYFNAAISSRNPVMLDPGQWLAAKRAAIACHATPRSWARSLMMIPQGSLGQIRLSMPLPTLPRYIGGPPYDWHIGSFASALRSYRRSLGF